MHSQDTRATENPAAAREAPDPRRYYPNPEELRDHAELDLAERMDLLAQWKEDVERALRNADKEEQAALNEELEQVKQALDYVTAEHEEYARR